MAFVTSSGNSTATFPISCDKAYIFVSKLQAFHLKLEKYLSYCMTITFLKNYPSSINSVSLPNFETLYQNCIHPSFFAL